MARRKTILLSESDLHEIITTAVNIILEDMDEACFNQLMTFRNEFSNVLKALVNEINGGNKDLVDEMNRDVKFGEFIKVNVYSFINNLVYALDRCLKSRTIEEGLGSFGNTLNDMGFYVPQFVRSGFNGYDEGYRKAKNWATSFAANGNNVTNGKVGGQAATQVRLKVLMYQEYKTLRSNLEGWINKKASIIGSDTHPLKLFIQEADKLLQLMQTMDRQTNS